MGWDLSWNVNAAALAGVATRFPWLHARGEFLGPSVLAPHICTVLWAKQERRARLDLQYRKETMRQVQYKKWMLAKISKATFTYISTQHPRFNESKHGILLSASRDVENPARELAMNRAEGPTSAAPNQAFPLLV